MNRFMVGDGVTWESVDGLKSKIGYVRKIDGNVVLCIFIFFDEFVFAEFFLDTGMAVSANIGSIEPIYNNYYAGDYKQRSW